MNEDPHETEGAEALIAALATEGVVDSVGAFTVDSTRARQLAERFRLADPEAFVVSLLQAAVLSGASRLEAEITPSRVVLAFDGVPFTLEELSQPEDVLLAPPGVVPQAPRRMALAEGLVGAAALTPRAVTVISGGPPGGSKLERRPGQPDQLARLVAPPPGTRITVEREVAPASGSAPEWEPPEAQRLISLGRFAPLSLQVNGKVVSEGRGLPEVWFETPVAGLGLEGLAGIEAAPHPPILFVVQGGAVIAEAALEAAPDGLIAVVQAPGVRRDISLAQVVKDEAWEAVRRAVEAAVVTLLETTRRFLAFPSKRDVEAPIDLARRTIRTAWLRGAFPRERLVEDLAVWPLLGTNGTANQISIKALRSRAKKMRSLPFLTAEEDAFPALDAEVLRLHRTVLGLPSEAVAERLEERLGARLERLDTSRAAPENGAPRGLLSRIARRARGWLGLLDR